MYIQSDYCNAHIYLGKLQNRVFFSHFTIKYNDPLYTIWHITISPICFCHLQYRVCIYVKITKSRVFLFFSHFTIKYNDPLYTNWHTTMSPFCFCHLQYRVCICVDITRSRVFSHFTITMTLYIQLDILPNACACRYVTYSGGDAKRGRLSLEQTIKGVYDKIVISTLRTTAYNTSVSSRTIPSVFERSP